MMLVLSVHAHIYLGQKGAIWDLTTMQFRHFLENYCRLTRHRHRDAYLLIASACFRNDVRCHEM